MTEQPKAIAFVCPRDYPWLRDGRCWPSHYYDNLAIYGPSVEPETTAAPEESA